jgi:hypothetical protein
MREAPLLGNLRDRLALHVFRQRSVNTLQTQLPQVV